MIKQDIFERLFNGYPIKDFDTNFTDKVVSIELVSDEEVMTSEDHYYTQRQSNYIALLRVKQKQKYDYYKELEKIVVPILKRQIEIAEDGTTFEINFTPAKLENEINILFEIKVYYYI